MPIYLLLSFYVLRSYISVNNKTISTNDPPKEKTISGRTEKCVLCTSQKDERLNFYCITRLQETLLGAFCCALQICLYHKV